ncbi:MAG: hypothetical protein J0I21_21650 [Alphaproteobacteria bacterium]|nr:hypothetical protein [Alphaproteobacteria bacterium]
MPPVDLKPRLEDIQKRGHDRVLVLVKALPHVGKKHGETVCCAGVTAEGRWRRQYPVHYRRLETEFSRWNWIEYDWLRPGGEDRRIESRRVQEETIRCYAKMAQEDRSRFLEKVIVPSCDAAAERGQSLALIRPRDTRFSWRPKPEKKLLAEKAAYRRAASQLSIFDAELAALEPCPFEFKFDYRTADGRSHQATCADWETATTYYRRSKRLGQDAALESMRKTFNEDYPARGMAFAMGTHSLYPKVWLLVGVLRLDPPPSQICLAL